MSNLNIPVQPSDEGEGTARQVVEYLEKLLAQHRNPFSPPALSAVEGFDHLRDLLCAVKDTLFQFSNGRFEYKLTQTGVLVGYIKTIQSHLRHLAWQCNQVAEGDLSQRVDFMGELSLAFNRMTESLAEQKRIIDDKKKELTILTKELRKEIKRRDKLEEALRANEQAYIRKFLLDPLTGIHNRGYFFESVAGKLDDLKRYPEKSACLVMINIDHFKKFNDTFGYYMGDQAVKVVTQVIGRALGDRDILARYGDEKFSLFLEGAGLESGLAKAERIRSLVESQPNPAGAEHPPLTISLGLCCVEGRRLLPGSPGTRILSEALNQADEALNEAKKHGRNQVRHSG
jgi:diguanylate cyclase (GGDEF)-like protein